MLGAFVADNMFLLFFVNGLAFFAVGLTIALEMRRASIFQTTESLWLLSAYAFVASLGNWLQMGALVQEPAYVHDLPTYLQVAKLLSFVVAVGLLMQFAIRTLVSLSSAYHWLPWLFGTLSVGYFTVLAAILSAPGALERDWWSAAEVSARYILYLPGLALSTLAMWRLSRVFWQLGAQVVARDCVAAAASFGFKTIVSGATALPILGSTSATLPAMAIPTQVARMLSTLAVAFFMVRVMRFYEIERRRQLNLALEERYRMEQEALAEERRVCDEIRRWGSAVADMVHEVSSASSQSHDIDNIMHTVLAKTLDLTGLKRGGVFLLQEEDQVLVRVAEYGTPVDAFPIPQRIPVGTGLAGHAAATGELLIVGDVVQDPRVIDSAYREQVQFHISVPLAHRGNVLGVMNLSDPEPHQLTDRHLEFLSAVGDQLGVAIEVARLYNQLKGMAALEERLRLGRELHDNLVQILGYLNLKSQLVQMAVRSDRLVEALDELSDMEEVSAQAYDDVRDSILGLRVTLSPGKGLVPALKEFVPEFSERSRIEIVLDTDDAAPLSFGQEAEVQVLRIIQEALTNVRRHARADRAWVRFRVNADHAVVVIKDQGCGFDPSQVGEDSKQHLGLQTMQERAESIGGRLWVDSQVGQGTEVVLHVPLS
jgi:signal transduction histidine kinase